jgi:hypothetical protein
MRQIVVVMIPWRILMVGSLHHGGSDSDQLDHKAKHAGP